MNAMDTSSILEAETSSLRVYCDPKNVTETCKENLRLQQEKADLKTSFLYSEYTRLYLEYLNKDKQNWPSVKDTESKLATITEERRAVKDELEQENDKLTHKLKQISTAYDALQEKKKRLEDKQEEFDKKQALFETKLELKPNVAKDAVQRCQHVIEKLENEIVNINTKLQSIDGSIQDLKAQLNKNISQQGTNIEHGISRAKNILSFMEFMTGVQVGVIDEDSIQIHFTNSQQPQPSMDEEGFSLTLTLKMETDQCGNIRLAGVTSNVDGLKIQDVADDAIANSDLPYLIRSVKHRWIHHFPLLSEIDILNKHHAVDWIEEQSKLRVLIGRCGKVMFTLSVPKDYPTTRNISLIDSYGVDNIDNYEFPGENATLLQWVKFLEDTFGDCE